MNNSITMVLSFIGGAAVGAVSAYIFTKKKYQKEMDEQLAPIRKEFDDYIQNVDKKLEEAKAETEKNVRESVRNEQKKEEATKLEKKVTELDYAAQKKKDGPYIIERGGEEFGGYMAVSLEYYTDGILLDGTDIVDEAEMHDIVGVDNLALLDEKNPLIWVRNDERQVDYEIAYIDEDFYPDEE